MAVLQTVPLGTGPDTSGSISANDAFVLVNAAIGAINVLASTTQTANYTLALADVGTVVEMNSASALTLTVPPAGTVAFPLGTVIECLQFGVGQVTVTAGAGVTLRSSAGLTTRTQYSTVNLHNRATNDWIVSGDLG